jgi:hypothetical protein
MKKILAFLLLALIGCATTPKSPEQVVYQASGDYAAALVVAVQYKKLPPCGGTTTTPLCRDAATLKRIQDADGKAADLLSNAQSAVRLESVAPETEKEAAATRAQRAIADFRKLTDTLPKGKP